MNTLLTITTIMLIVIMLIMLSVIIYIGYQLNSELSKKRKLNELLTYSNIYNNMESFEDKLNEFITGKIDEYQAYHADVFSDYISDKKQREIIKDIHKDVLLTMSPTLLAQLMIVYNKDHLDEIMNKKITLGVIAIVIDSNAQME